MARTSGNVAFAGASIAENTSYVNGLNLTNFRTGVGFSKVPFEFYETMQVKTGGYSVKYGRSTGGGHGPIRRRPVVEAAFADTWGAAWP